VERKIDKQTASSRMANGVGDDKLLKVKEAKRPRMGGLWDAYRAPAMAARAQPPL